MSTAIKPKEGIVYECYKGYTDSGNDRVRVGQKFVWDGDDYGSQYAFDKASGRGMCVLVPKDKFSSYFCPAAEQTKQSETESKFKIGDKVILSDDSQWHSWSDFNNPADTEGTILEINDEDLGIVVEWSNDTSNSYNERDLLLWKAKPKSYLDGVENKDSKPLKLKNMNLSAIAITDLEQIKAIAELIPSVKEQIMAQYPELFETKVESKHKVGNRYEHSDGQTYILAGEHNHVALVNLSTGMIESRTIPVDDYNNITADDFEMLCDDTEELELIEF
jgi:hypothetical protein